MDTGRNVNLLTNRTILLFTLSMALFHLSNVALLPLVGQLSKGTGRFNLLQGVVYSAIGLGGSISSIVAGSIVEQFGYPIGFASLAGVGVLGTLSFILFVPESKDLAMGTPEKEKLKPAV